MDFDVRKISGELASQAKFAAQGLDFSVVGPGASQEVRVLLSALSSAKDTPLRHPLGCGSLICNVAGLFYMASETSSPVPNLQKF